MRFLSLVFLTLPMLASELSIPEKNLMAPSALNHIQLIKTNNHFLVESSQGLRQVVKPFDVDRKLREMSDAQLRAYLEKNNRIKISCTNNGDYMLRAFVPGNGGGWVAGKLAKGTVLTVGYTSAAAILVVAIAIDLAFILAVSQMCNKPSKLPLLPIILSSSEPITGGALIIGSEYLAKMRDFAEKAERGGKSITFLP